MQTSHLTPCATCSKDWGFKCVCAAVTNHIFFGDGIEEILNLQPRGTNAKPYQVKQVRQVILKYKLADGKL